MNKTLSRKFIYVITVLALLAMMVPAMAIPVSAAPNPTLTMTVAGVADGTSGRAFNISGSIVTITAVGGTPIAWNLSNITTQPGYAPAAWYPSTPADNATSVQVIGIWGEANITATFAGDPNPVTVSVNKKWGMIDHTSISPSGQQYVTWTEATKSWFAQDNITDTVYADFIEDGAHTIKVAQGTVLDWYLVSGLVNAAPQTNYAPDLNSWAMGLADAQYTQFITGTPDPMNHAGTGWNGTHIQTVSGINGTSTVNIGAWFEENVQIIVVPSYPNNPNKKVTSELTSYNFGTREMEVVPQVRWAGEKIVLEANFGMGDSGVVKFFLQNTSVGTLEAIDSFSTQSTVWADPDDNGTASVILTSGTNGQADVSAAYYPDGPDGAMTNQMAFRVYFLNFESITLTDVNGKRAGHNTGLWTTENPFNENFPAGVAENDLTDQTLNVSQDALERVQVRGYFVPPAGAQMSTRPYTTIDLNGDGDGDVAAPQGRWVLPDDWAKLAGSNWTERRIHWDIMTSPDYATSGVLSVVNSSLGDYMQGPKEVSEYKVIGPFAPGLEVMTPSGWMIPNTPVRLADQTNFRNTIQTVVPDGLLNAWDAPMPPAKIILEVMAGNGFFKDAMKTDIYYHMVGTLKEYTNPFYQILIPANPLIPAFNQQGGGGYDWNSYDGTHGPYEFWTIINQPYMNEARPSDAQHPTKIEIYSDNHGEAMAWLNGDWNLNLGIYKGKGGADVPLDANVGDSTIQASADYPYVRNDQPIISTEVMKHWFWSGQILGTDGHDFGTNPDTGEPIGVPTESSNTLMVLTAGHYTIENSSASYPNEIGKSNDKVVWVWATDRDGLQAGVLGTKVQWRVTGGAYIPDINADEISNYNSITQGIHITGGFITAGIATPDPAPAGYPTAAITNDDGTRAFSYLRVPTTVEKQLFFKKWPNLYSDQTGAADINFAVAAIDLLSSAAVDCTVEEILTGPDFGYPGQPLGNVTYSTNVDFNKAYPIDDPIVAGDANVDGKVNIADIATVERIIMGIDSPNSNADVDSNGSVDMGDVVKINNIILKIK